MQEIKLDDIKTFVEDILVALYVTYAKEEELTRTLFLHLKLYPYIMKQ